MFPERLRASSAIKHFSAGCYGGPLAISFSFYFNEVIAY